MDEIRGRWEALCDQSGVRVLWRGSGHEHEIEPQRDAVGHAEFDLHELRDHARWRRLVGRHDERKALASGGLASAAVDTGVGAEGGASEFALYDASLTVSVHRSRVGGSEGRAD